MIETLDLSHQTNLTYLNCTDNQLTSLDLSNNPKLETIYAGKNKLLAIRIPDDIEPFCVLTEQRPAAFDLPAGENGFLLSDLVPWMDADQVSQLNGAVLQDDRIQLDSPNQTITYHYTDGAAELDATVTVTGEMTGRFPCTLTTGLTENRLHSRRHSLHSALLHFSTRLSLKARSSRKCPFMQAPGMCRQS